MAQQRQIKPGLAPSEQIQIFANDLYLVLKTLGYTGENTPIMFYKPNVKEFFPVSHFLFTALDSVRASKTFKLCWPLVTKQTEALFRNICLTWLNELRVSEPEIPEARMAIFQSPGREAFLKVYGPFARVVIRAALQHRCDLSVPRAMSEMEISTRLTKVEGELKLLTDTHKLYEQVQTKNLRALEAQICQDEQDNKIAATRTHLESLEALDLVYSAVDQLDDLLRLIKPLNKIVQIATNSENSVLDGEELRKSLPDEESVLNMFPKCEESYKKVFPTCGKMDIVDLVRFFSKCFNEILPNFATGISFDTKVEFEALEAQLNATIQEHRKLEGVLQSLERVLRSKLDPQTVSIVTTMQERLCEKKSEQTLIGGKVADQPQFKAIFQEWKRSTNLDQLVENSEIMIALKKLVADRRSFIDAVANV